jgi:hypothetical protein
MNGAAGEAAAGSDHDRGLPAPPGPKASEPTGGAWIATASQRHHLLVRRTLTDPTDPTDLAFFYAYVPANRPATLHTLVTIAGRRWPVEEDFQISKDDMQWEPPQLSAC